MRQTKFRGYKLFYEHAEAAESMIRQIDEFPSFFTPRGERPLIIDCGANIGISVLEWKSRWPQANILCFEPDPHAFRLLEKTIEANDIPGVRCVAAALSDVDGTATLYGDVSARGDARGNSIDPAWGDRDESGQVSVSCVRLSSYLNDQEVSFLKLDIEGAEQRVLEEIAPKLGQVQAMYVEVHETALSKPSNSVAAIESLLGTAGFEIESESRYEAHSLPAHLDRWRRRVDATQTQLLAWRS